jgi:putative toxin-antitoxin system antitoxin component (TIGR02293 family)
MAQPRRKPARTTRWLRNGRQQWSDLELARMVAEGIPTSVLPELVDEGILTREEVSRLIVPRRTLAHRKRRGERLSPDESDRLARVLHVHDVGLQVFDGNEDMVRTWLRNPNRALGGEAPLDLVTSSAGARLVEDTLRRLEHGVYS